MSSPSGTPDEPPVPFKDAESWLAERGIRREPLEVTPDPPAAGATPPRDAVPTGDTPAGMVREDTDADGHPAGSVPLSARDAARLAGQAAADARLRAEDASAVPSSAARGLDDDVAAAVGFVRRSTSAAPQAEGRLRTKLLERGCPDVVVEAALERARRERLVDDPAMAASLVAEQRAKGHAVARIRRDLRARGFDDAVLGVALGEAEAEDPEAAAFAVAQSKAAALNGLTAETAFRRVVGHVVRRGYPEGLSRKVAREAVFAARDAERTAGH